MNLQDTVGFANEFELHQPEGQGKEPEWFGRRLAGGMRYDGAGF